MERLGKITDVGLPVIVGDKNLYPVECYDCCIDNKVAKKLLNDAITKLVEYEDLEEQGRLMKLPCEIGHRVYMIYQFCGEGAWEIEEHKIKLEDLENIGKTVFLTREEAEAALKEL